MQFPPPQPLHPRDLEEAVRLASCVKGCFASLPLGLEKNPRVGRDCLSLSTHPPSQKYSTGARFNQLCCFITAHSLATAPECIVPLQMFPLSLLVGSSTTQLLNLVVVHLRRFSLLRHARTCTQEGFRGAFVATHFAFSISGVFRILHATFWVLAP